MLEYQAAMIIARSWPSRGSRQWNTTQSPLSTEATVAFSRVSLDDQSLRSAKGL